jgi:hypothetical protein
MVITFQVCDSGALTSYERESFVELFNALLYTLYDKNFDKNEFCARTPYFVRLKVCVHSWVFVYATDSLHRMSFVITMYKQLPIIPFQHLGKSYAEIQERSWKLKSRLQSTLNSLSMVNRATG